MEKITESATSNVKNTESSTLPDTNSAKEVTLPTPLPNIMMLGAVLLATLGTIVLGYFKGNMHLLTVLKNAREFYS
mgnify:FL=1|jgi:hypothetical protein|tara:strand:+ start:599 stop:826 length:228 start_codon:yes stop_codon:yes gene_type:complete